MIIHEIREGFYKERLRRNFKKKYPDIFCTNKPDVVRFAKEYEEVFDRRKELVLEGKVVLGALVMANELLFSNENNYDCPALFIYSHDEYFDVYQYELELLACKIYDFRNLPQDELLKDLDIKDISDRLNKETIPIFNYRIPKKLTNDKEVFVTTVIVRREDIKNSFIEERFYPLIVKEGIKSGIILNYKFYDRKAYRKDKCKKLKKRIFRFSIKIIVRLCIYVVLLILFNIIRMVLKGMKY